MACTADRTKRLVPTCLIAYRVPDPLRARSRQSLLRPCSPCLSAWAAIPLSRARSTRLTSGSDGKARIRDVLYECQSSVPNVHPSLAGCVVGSFVGPWAINADMKAACGND
ncbi:hypothetical protein LIA77_05425 [Sarocladium implicatum]|nr:hypothetical protein LIA77_05425 [Sarocladium implicatum]